MRATTRQKELMNLIMPGDGRDWLDIDQLIERLELISKVGSKQSVQCSLRKLEAHGVIARDYRVRRGRNRVVLMPTGKAYILFPLSVPSGTPGTSP